MSKFIKYDLEITPPKERSGKVGALYADIHGAMKLVPEPFTIHSPNDNLLACVWNAFRETLYVGHVDHGLKQAIATVISELNVCPWCVDAHSMMLHATGNTDTLRGIRDGADVDVNTRQLLDWAYASLNADSDLLHHPPFASEDAPEIIGTALTFHYLNRVVNVLLEETPLSTRLPFREGFKRTMGLVYRGISGGKIENLPDAGTSIKFLEHHTAPLPEVFRWAQTSPTISTVFSAWQATMDTIAHQYIPTEVQMLTQNVIDQWNGEQQAIGKGWLEDAIANLNDENKAIARIILLTALTSNQVTNNEVQALRNVQHDDNFLVSIIAWGAYQATYRISEWLNHTPDQ